MADYSERIATLARQMLTLCTVEQQADCLQEADALHFDDLAALLDHARQRAGDDPGQAQRLAEACGMLAESIGAYGLAAQATYVRAQTHSINAEFDAALSLIDTARAGYLKANQPIDALRTDVGRMGVLIELGRYADALDVGHNVIAQLQNAADSPLESAETRELVGMTQQNCGMAYELMGRFDEAMQAYATAETHFRELDAKERLGDVSNNRGVVLLNLGRAREALAAFEAAAEVFSHVGRALKTAQSLVNIGNAHLLLEQYTPGLTAFERARILLKPLHALADQHVLLLDLADAQLALNLFPEALSAYQEATNSLRTAGMTHDLARALWGLGAALLALGQWDAATGVLEEAAEAFATTQNTPMRCNVRLQQAGLLSLRGEPQAGLGLARQALAMTANNRWPVQQISAHMRVADLLLPDVAQARPHLQAAAALAEQVGLPSLNLQVKQRLGHIALLAGQFSDAESVLQAVAVEIEQTRTTLVQERMRTAFLGDKLAVYEDLLRLYLQRNDEGDVVRAFEATERAKARTLGDVLMGHIKPAKLDDMADDATHIQLHALQNELSATYTALLSGDFDTDGENSLLQLQNKAIDLERTISRVQLQSLLTASAHVGPVPIQSGTHSALPISIDIVLLAYAICGEDITAFVVANQAVHVVRNISTTTRVQPLLDKLSMQWDRFREETDFVQRHAAMLEKSTQRILQALYTELMQPVEALLRECFLNLADGAMPVVVVPHGLLHHVPFQALFDGQRYIIERYELSYMPSAALLPLCQNRKPAESGKAVVFGVSDALIPAAAAEAQAVAKYLPGATVRINAQATLGELYAQAPGCAIVHLACHGFFRADNPLFSSLKLYDGWLMAADVPGLDLHGALVTLSACESGRNQVLAGDELVGLTRVFLSAGASTLLTSLWLVHDAATATLMQDFYAQLGHGMGRAAALRLAQLALKHTHPHPYYWAPFVIVGQR